MFRKASGPAGDAPTIVVEFVILSTQLTHQQLVQGLGVNPTRAWRKGEPSGPTGIGAWLTNGVALTASHRPLSGVEEQLQVISGLIGRNSARIRDLVLDGSATVNLWISIQGPSSAFGFTITPASFRFLTEVGASLQFDAYGMGPDGST